MTEHRDTEDRAAKRMRRIARGLALIWAGLLTLGVVGVVYVFALIFGEFLYGLGALLVLIAWVSAVIAWRSERAGGVVLVLEGLPGAFPATPGLAPFGSWDSVARSLAEIENIGNPSKPVTPVEGV